VSRLALGFLRSIADADAVPAFRPQALGESNASRRGLELVATDAVATPRGRWGIVTRADPAEPAAPVVVRVAPGSPASAGGMLPGDRLLAIDGASVAGQDDMVARLKAAATEVSIDIERRGRFAELRLRSPEPAMERDGHRSGGN
jgi:S1-C subfamily serine protease